MLASNTEMIPRTGRVGACVAEVRFPWKQRLRWKLEVRVSTWREEKEADWGVGGRKCSGSPTTGALGTPRGPLSQNDPLEFSPVRLIWTGPYTSSSISYWMRLTWEGIRPLTRQLFASEAKPWLGGADRLWPSASANSTLSRL